MLTTEEIVKMQNKICLEEFKRNYDKDEYVRVYLELVEEPTEDVVTLQNALQAQVKEGYKVKVSSMGTISITKRVEGFSVEAWQEVKHLSPTIKLPYAYVMGKKVGKRAMQAFVSQYE